MKTQQSTKVRLLKALGAVLVIELTLSIIATIIVYPTDSHRATGRALSAYQAPPDQVVDGKIATENSKKYQTSLNSPEGQYSEKAGFLAAFFQILIGIGIIGALYTYIRKRRIAKDAVAATAFMYAFSSLIVGQISLVFGALYIGDALSINLFSVTSAVWGSVIAFVIAYIVAKLNEKRMNRKHSFEVV